ncbi:DUF21 domain-containing protein At2g14520-like [Magnolia sinica]|uniref:DUF21 domain-containing protein At2g14520-like n=1 Tax=Magnolia sinica TaxID=86752 RepID=UPI0026594DDF|nr:DUF21 domain-containing protein At2g14520-like [Magnolia sinica]
MDMEINEAKILPVVRKQHLLLCTLLICNAAAMETLPIFLDSLVTAWGAILISVTLILLFGELLDVTLGDGHVALFRRAELKTLVDFHGNEAGKGGELMRNETTIIAGALELTEKTARDAMTSISETFAIDINAKLDRDMMKLILDEGHSRVPVYHEKPTNIIGLILVKSKPFTDSAEDVRLYIDGEGHHQEKNKKNKRSLKKWKNSHSSMQNGNSRSRRWVRDMSLDVLQIDDNPLPKLAQEEEAVGIITMEDVIEELLQEEIFDETDYHEDL